MWDGICHRVRPRTPSVLVPLMARGGAFPPAVALDLPHGTPPRRLFRSSAVYMAVLLTPPMERQKLLLTLYEVLALVSGLILPLPMVMMRRLRPDEGSVVAGSRPLLPRELARQLRPLRQPGR